MEGRSLRNLYVRWPLRTRRRCHTVVEHRVRSASRLKPLLRAVREAFGPRRKACGEGGRRRHRLGVLVRPGQSQAGWTRAALYVPARPRASTRNGIADTRNSPASASPNAGTRQARVRRPRSPHRGSSRVAARPSAQQLGYFLGAAIAGGAALGGYSAFRARLRRTVPRIGDSRFSSTRVDGRARTGRPSSARLRLTRTNKNARAGGAFVHLCPQAPPSPKSLAWRSLRLESSVLDHPGMTATPGSTMATAP